MNHKLKQVLIERVASGLKRKTIVSCSKWAEAYRVMGQPLPGNWSFKHHPWARDIHDDESEMLVSQKGAQLALTETALNKTFYNIDIKGNNCLYILPASDPDASDFSTSRFDPALELSSHLRNLFSDVKNIGHKRAGNANLFIRGSRSRSQLKSVPAAFMVFDEVDEMVQENIPLAFERTSGQLDSQKFLLSTPTIENHGINFYYKQSTQSNYFFRCPNCSKLTCLIFPECLVIPSDDFRSPKLVDTHLICKECKKPLPTSYQKGKGDLAKCEYLANGIWVPAYTDRVIKGYHVSQLYSTVLHMGELAASYLKGQMNPSDEQEFFNSKLGLTHAPEGAKVTDAQIDACIGNYKKVTLSPPNSIVTLGVDVGKWLHYVVEQWFFTDDVNTYDLNLLAKCRVLKEDKCLNFEELDALMINYRVRFCVIDANPEKRKALEFANRFYGNVKLCYYGRGIVGKQMHIHSDEECTLSVDRTSWMDLALGRFQTKRIVLPVDTSLEYRNHLKAPVRITKKDADGNPVARWLTPESQEDHFAHARTYSEIALPLAANLAQVRNITDAY